LQAPEGACCKIFHIGSARGTTVRKFVDMIADVTGNAHLIQFGAVRPPGDQDIPCLVSDPGRAERELGWTPVDDLEQRVHSAAEWWLQRLGLRTGLS
jgi:nucleoside-diphosphate-sugar epimerase